MLSVSNRTHEQKLYVHDKANYIGAYHYANKCVHRTVLVVYTWSKLTFATVILRWPYVLA